MNGNVTPFIPKNGRFRLQRVRNDSSDRFFIIDPAIGIFPEGQSFIRELTRWRGGNSKSVRAAAYIIIDWCNYLRSTGLNWHQATDEEFLSWLGDQKISKKRLSRKNAIIWRWYKHLYNHDAYKASAASTLAHISIPTNDSEFGRPRYVPRRGSRDDRNSGRDKKSRTFISDETVATIIANIARLGNSFIVDRDSLIVAYEVGCGLRAIGISDIQIFSISSALQKSGIIPKHVSIFHYGSDKAAQADIRVRLDRLLDIGGHGIFINVMEKFSKSRDVLIEVGLIHQTLDFIWRHHEKWKSGSPASELKNHLFLSLKTGQGLLPGTVSDVVRRYFKRFGLDGSGHDLRRYKITSRGLELVRKSKKHGKLFDGTAIEVAMADEFGHDDFKTMSPYVNMGRILDAIGDEVDDHYRR
ncbi:hypothetical protein [Sphingomonas sp. OTU376]|uniref:hypothetical protein n=1 Tax=Sphingomonas sp. OTU376 TaxID=3043863 RepID=UPI00313EF96E